MTDPVPFLLASGYPVACYFPRTKGTKWTKPLLVVGVSKIPAWLRSGWWWNVFSYFLFLGGIRQRCVTATNGHCLFVVFSILFFSCLFSCVTSRDTNRDTDCDIWGDSESDLRISFIFWSSRMVTSFLPMPSTSLSCGAVRHG